MPENRLNNSETPTEADLNESLKAQNSRMPDPLSQLLYVTAQILSQRMTLILILVMNFSLAIWSMIIPRWIRLAIAGAFTLTSFIIARFGFKE